MCAAALLFSVAAVQADQVTVSGTNFPDSRITNLREGRLHFRAADGTDHDAWISDVDLIIVDRGGVFSDFNQAERFLAGGEPERAIIRYRRTLRLSDAFWPDLIAARLLVACDLAGRLGQATLNFVRVVRGKPLGAAAATRLIPRTIPAKRTAAAMRAVQHLDGALKTHPGDGQRVPLELFRFLILSRTADARADAAARNVARLDIPEDLRCQRLYSIELEALQRLTKAGMEAADRAGLDRAIRDCPDDMLADFLLLKGRWLLRTASTRDDIIRATWPLMRVVAHMPDDARAAEGLYETGLALERIGRPDRAVDLLKECLSHARLTADTAQVAEHELERLEKQQATP